MKLILATLLSLFLISVANAQASDRHNVFNLACHGLKKLPFADEKSEAKELEPVGIDGLEVHRKSYELADEQIVFFEACDASEKIPDNRGRILRALRWRREGLYCLRRKWAGLRLSFYFIRRDDQKWVHHPARGCCG